MSTLSLTPIHVGFSKIHTGREENVNWKLIQNERFWTRDFSQHDHWYHVNYVIDPYAPYAETLISSYTHGLMFLHVIDQYDTIYSMTNRQKEEKIIPHLTGNRRVVVLRQLMGHLSFITQYFIFIYVDTRFCPTHDYWKKVYQAFPGSGKMSLDISKETVTQKNVRFPGKLTMSSMYHTILQGKTCNS